MKIAPAEYSGLGMSSSLRTPGPRAELVCPAPDNDLLFLAPFGFSFTSCPLPPERPHPQALRVPAPRPCYCTLSNTCWQLPEITPERGRGSSPARGMPGVRAKPFQAVASIFTLSTSKGNFF